MSQVQKVKVQRKLNFILTTPAKAAQARDRVVTPSSSRSIEERNEQLKKKQTKVYSAGLAKARLELCRIVDLRSPTDLNTVFQCVRSFFPEGTPNIDQVRNDVYIAMCEKVRPVRDKFYEIFYAGKSSETVQLYKYFNMVLLPCNLLLLDGGSCDLTVSERTLV